MAKTRAMLRSLRLGWTCTRERKCAPAYTHSATLTNHTAGPL